MENVITGNIDITGDFQTDTLLSGYKIIQDRKGFMFGIDAVLLSNFAFSSIKMRDSGVDLGTGNGIIPLLLVDKVAHITGLEIQQKSAALAQKSVELNNLNEKIQVMNGDIKNVQTLFAKHAYDFVTSNPPYMISEHGKENPADEKAIARHEVLCKLEDVISAAEYLLKPHGKFFMIHRPFRLAEIFNCLQKYKLEPKRMCLVSPFAASEPNLVLIEARKNAQSRLKIEPEIIVYEKPGVYTERVKTIYKETALK